jgi:hypothetical protein
LGPTVAALASCNVEHINAATPNNAMNDTLICSFQRADFDQGWCDMDALQSD